MVDTFFLNPPPIRENGSENGRLMAFWNISPKCHEKKSEIKTFVIKLNVISLKKNFYSIVIIIFVYYINILSIVTVRCRRLIGPAG